MSAHGTSDRNVRFIQGMPYRGAWSRPLRGNWGAIALPSASAVIVAWLATHGHSSLLVLGLLALLAGPFVLSRPENALLLGTFLVLVVPASVALGPAQAGVVRIAVALSFVGFLVLVVRGATSPPRLAAEDVFLAALVSAAWVGTALTSSNSGAVKATLAAVLPAGFYLSGRWFGAIAWTRLASVVLFATTAGSVTVLYEFFVSHKPLFATQSSYFWNATNQTLFRPGGVFGSPPAAAATLAMSILIGAPLLMSVTGTRRLLVWIGLGVSLAGLIVTFTRAGLIGFAIGLAVYLFLLRPRNLGRNIYVLIAVATAFAIFVLPHVTRTSWYREGITRAGDLAVRQSYWSAAWPVIVNSPKHFVIGHGINSLLLDSRTDELVYPQPDIAAVPTLSTLSPHSQYVRTLVEEGIVGLVLLLGWLVGAGVRAGRAALNASSPQRAVLAACAAATVAFLVVSYVGDSLRETAPFALVALITGSAVTLARSSEHREDAR